MDNDQIGYTDFVTMAASQPSASRDAARAPDFAALADAERADAEAFRLA